MGVIEDVVRRDTSMRVKGHYIRIKYLFKKATAKDILLMSENHTVGNPECGNGHRVENPETNALSLNSLNTLSQKQRNALSGNPTPSVDDPVNKSKKKKDNIPYEEIIDYLNEKVGTQYRYQTEITRKLIRARWKEGFRLEDFKKVIDNKCRDWLNDSEMEKYLRPQTLFNNKFESYLNEKRQVLSEEAIKILRGEL